MNRGHRLVGLLVVGVSVASTLVVPVVHADATNGDIFYTTFSGNDRVFKRSYSFDGTTLTYGTDTVISTIVPGGLSGADGIVFDPTNTSFLIVGGQDGHFNRVDISTGTATQSSSFTSSGATIFHLVVDPSKTSVWGSGIPDSPIVNLSLSPFNSSSTVLPVINAVGTGDTSLTGLAFVGSTAYYTSSPAPGTGSFGTIDLTTGETTRLFSGIPAAHGLIFDSFTGDLILTGDSEIRQFDPISGLFVGPTLTLSGNQFDQGTADGKGHLFVASNDGDMLFVDYRSSGLVGDASNVTDLRFFRANLDDVAPLSGEGSREPVIPEPASLLLFGLGGIGAAFTRRRRLSRV